MAGKSTSKILPEKSTSKRKYKNGGMLYKPSSLILIVFLFLLLIASFSKNTFSIANINKEIRRESKTNTALNILIPTIAPTIAPSSIPIKTPPLSPIPVPKITLTSAPTPISVIIKQSNSQGLLSAVNAFRSKNGLGALSSDSILCSIAQSRANENAALGSLDNHAGFDNYFKGQTEFKGMGENLHWATYSETATEIVENGWAKSSGHRENMLNSKWQYGCGGQAGTYFAFFIFASK